MNCKPGDLAVIVRSKCGNEGRIVKVVSFYGRASFMSGDKHDDCWLVEGNLNTFTGANACRMAQSFGADGCIPDAFLRPIRDPGDDAVDETLNWLPVPVKETA